MRLAALPALVASTLLQATFVRPLRVPPTRPNLSQAPHPETAPFEEQEGTDDEFEVRLTPEEVKAASRKGFRRDRRSVCPVLQLGTGAARKLYFNDTNDGLGSRILDVIGALMYADRMSLGFAGVVSYGKASSTTSHNVSIPAGMQAFFGFADVSELYFEDPPRNTQTFPILDELTQQLEAGAIGNGVHVQVEHGANMGDVNYRVQTPPTILAKLRHNNTYIMQMPLLRFPPTGRPGPVLNVAVHVRRGDVDPWLPVRGTRPRYYLWLMDLVRSRAPYATFHVFSEKRRDSAREEFEKYSEWGAVVHLDTEARETLAHMARADVLVTARSSFSYAAALLNANCVLSQRWMMPGRGWVSLPQFPEQLDKHQIESLTQEIDRCITSTLARKYGRH